MLFGAHVSVAQGYAAALDYAVSVGCECAQIFAKSPRQWKSRATDENVAESFRQQRAELGFGPVFTHTAYLINLATDDESLRAKSIAALADELQRAQLLGADGVVTHLGNDPAEDPVRAAQRVAEAMTAAFLAAGAGARSPRLLLENTAGAGRTFGSSFEQLAACIDATGMPPERLGVCLDTCHAFAFGAALDSEDGWRALTNEIAGTVGIDRLGLIHANDCKFERGSRRDRHAWIGDGFIGEDGFRAMVCIPDIAGVPVVTEAPGEVPVKDEINVGRLLAFRQQCG